MVTHDSNFPLGWMGRTQASNIFRQQLQVKSVSKPLWLSDRESPPSAPARTVHALQRWNPPWYRTPPPRVVSRGRSISPRSLARPPYYFHGFRSLGVAFIHHDQNSAAICSSILDNYPSSSGLEAKFLQVASIGFPFQFTAFTVC